MQNHAADNIIIKVSPCSTIAVTWLYSPEDRCETLLSCESMQICKCFARMRAAQPELSVSANVLWLHVAAVASVQMSNQQPYCVVIFESGLVLFEMVEIGKTMCQGAAASRLHVTDAAV